MILVLVANGIQAVSGWSSKTAAALKF